MDKLRESAMAALEARDELSQVLLEAIGTGGWIPTPLQQSFRLALADEVRSAEALRAALAEHAPIRKPIAWLCKFVADDGTTRTQFVEQDPAGLRWNDAGEPSPYSVTPLVDALAEQAPARAPLTDEQIDDLADDFKSQYLHGGTTFDEFDHFGFARAIERAHGIGAAP